MWFKNIHYYQCVESIPYDVDALTASLEPFAFEPCAKVLPFSLGWVPPMPKLEEAPLVHAANGILMLCLQLEEKIIPAAVVREQWQQRVEELEQNQHRKIGKREKQAIKDEVHHQLVTLAFSKHTRTYAYIDTVHNYLVVDAATPKRAETVTELLRKSLGHCKLAVADPSHLPSLMTRWLQHEPADTFEVAEACVLQNTRDEKSLVRCQRQDLSSPNVHGFIQAGSQVIQLAMKWQEQIEFVLKQDFSLSQIRFLDSVQDNLMSGEHETAAQKFDTDVVIMTETLRLFLQDLLKITEFKAKTMQASAMQAEALLA